MLRPRFSQFSTVAQLAEYINPLPIDEAYVQTMVICMYVCPWHIVSVNL